MGCCASRDAGKRGRRRRSPAEPPPPLPPSQKTHLPKPRAVIPPPPEEETVVKEVLSETPLPKRSSPEVREAAATTRKVRLEEEAPETKVLISKLEEAAEIVSEYSEMCSAASGSMSTATTATAATDRRDYYEVTSGDHREPRRLQRPNADSGRSPVRAPRKRQPAGGVRPPQSQSRSPARRAQAARPELGERRREFSGELRVRQRNVGTTTSRGGSRRSSRSPAPAARRDRAENKPEKAPRIPPPVGVQNGGGRSRELGIAKKNDIDTEEGPGKATEEEEGEAADRAAVTEPEGNESLIDNPHVSLECFIFL